MSPVPRIGVRAATTLNRVLSLPIERIDMTERKSTDLWTSRETSAACFTPLLVPRNGGLALAKVRRDR